MEVRAQELDFVLRDWNLTNFSIDFKEQRQGTGILLRLRFKDGIQYFEREID